MGVFGDYRIAILFALVLWPYGSWLTLYFLRKSVRAHSRSKSDEAPGWLTVTPVVPILLYIAGMLDAFVQGPRVFFAWLGAGILVGYLTRWQTMKTRSKVLDEWARTIPLSPAQSKAMTELWKSYMSKKVPPTDPLAKLKDFELSDLLAVTSIENRPKLFGRGMSVYNAQMKAFTAKGYSQDQAHVLCGMMLSRIGRQPGK